VSLYIDHNKTVGKDSYTFFCGTRRYDARFTLQPDLPQQMAYMHGLDRLFVGNSVFQNMCSIFWIQMSSLKTSHLKRTCKTLA